MTIANNTNYKHKKNEDDEKIIISSSSKRKKKKEKEREKKTSITNQPTLRVFNYNRFINIVYFNIYLFKKYI